MTEELSVALKKVRDILQREAHPHCVAVDIMFNSQGYELNYRLRSPGGLERDGISMRNLRGEFISKATCPPTEEEPEREAAPAAEGAAYIGKIVPVMLKLGAVVTDERGINRIWPKGVEIPLSQGEVKTNQKFEASWDGQRWTCRAPGFGRAGRDFGIGPLTVSHFSSVTIIPVSATD